MANQQAYFSFFSKKIDWWRPHDAGPCQPLPPRGDPHLVEGLLQGQPQSGPPPQVGPLHPQRAQRIRGHAQQAAQRRARGISHEVLADAEDNYCF